MRPVRSGLSYPLAWALSLCAHASPLSITILQGSFSYHPITPTEYSRRFSRKLSPSGRLIQTDLNGVRIDTHSLAWHLFSGSNSVGAPIHGIALSRSMGHHYGISLSPVVGAYHQARAPFARRRLTSLYPFMPVAGLDLTLRAPIGAITGNDHSFIALVNFLSPALTTHALAVGFSI